MRLCVINMRGTLVFPILLLTLIFVGLIHPFQTRSLNGFRIDKEIIVFAEDEASNVTKLPMIIIELENGSLVNFSSVDEALIQIYGGKLVLDAIKNVNISLFEEYGAYIKNETESISYVPALKVFYQKLSPELLKEYENYTGQIVPVSEGDYIFNRYGDNYPRIALYGKIPYFNITVLNTTSNTTEEQNILKAGPEIFLLIYARIETNETLNVILNYTRSITERFEGEVYALVIDITNSFNISSYSLEETFPNGLIMWDNYTETIVGMNGTFEAFTINCTYDIPLIVILDSDGLIWFKTLGLFDADQLATYISMYINKGAESLPLYPILAVVPKDPYAGKSCKVYIIVGFGFGNITEAKLSYSLLDANNKTIYRTSKPISVSPDTLTYTIESLDNRTRWITLNATIVTTYGVFRSEVFVYQVQYEEKKERGPIEEILPIVYAVIALIVILGISIKVYRKYFGK